MQTGNQKVMDKNCPRADNLQFKCNTPIDGAEYIGVSYDTTKKYDN